jgi:hypothetical protein
MNGLTLKIDFSEASETDSLSFNWFFIYTHEYPVHIFGNITVQMPKSYLLQAVWLKRHSFLTKKYTTVTKNEVTSTKQ